MSGDTVISRNALQFTNDNLHAYAYSGIITNAASGTADSIALDFTTNSEYIRARITILSDEVGGASLYTRIEMNGETIFRQNLDSSSAGGFQFDNPFYIIIPPFTRFVVKVGANATVDFTVMVTGKVGMPPRVGNLDE
tara:strand:+ start:97 stop:510 length:414 start_codon:yes stop_codon:yes gene_type:complete